MFDCLETVRYSLLIDLAKSEVIFSAIFVYFGQKSKRSVGFHHILKSSRSSLISHFILIFKIQQFFGKFLFTCWVKHSWKCYLFHYLQTNFAFIIHLKNSLFCWRVKTTITWYTFCFRFHIVITFLLKYKKKRKKYIKNIKLKSKEIFCANSDAFLILLLWDLLGWESPESVGQFGGFFLISLLFNKFLWEILRFLSWTIEIGFSKKKRT